MTDLVPVSDTALATRRPPDFALFDEIVARFLATLKEKTRETYMPGLALYREIASQAGADPMKADALIFFNDTLTRMRRDKDGTLANDTVRARMSAVQSFFSWAWAIDLSPVKPERVRAILKKPPARELSPRDVLTTEEAAALLAAAGDDETRVLIRVMLDAGLRISEALALAAGDVYAAGGRYYVKVQAGKGDRDRDVETGAGLYHALAELAAGHGLDVRDARHSARRLFTLSRLKAWRRVKRAAERAAIERNVTPHCLRHTHAQELAMQGWPLQLIAERLGHASIDTTRIYTRPARMLLQIGLPKMPWNSET